MVGICACSVTHSFVVSEQIRKTLSKNVSQNLTIYTFVSSFITMKFRVFLMQNSFNRRVTGVLYSKEIILLAVEFSELPNSLKKLYGCKYIYKSDLAARME